MSEKPFWWPVRMDKEYLDRLRVDYPENASMSDEDLIDYYGEGWVNFSDTWDHLGDARAEYEKLAEAFLQLVSETGKSPNDFNHI
jgi:hypothetical protein